MESFTDNINENNLYFKKIIKPSPQDYELHKKYLMTLLYLEKTYHQILKQNLSQL